MARAYHLVGELLREGHEVDTWFYGDNGGWPAPMPPALTLRAFPYAPPRSRLKALASMLPDAAAPCDTPELAAALRAVRPGDFDVVVVERTFLGARLAELRSGAAPWVLDADNVEATLARQQAHAASSARRRARLTLEALRIARQERDMVRAADLVVACSEPDRAVLEGIGARRVVTHANGVDTAELSWRDHATPEGARVLFLGSMDYPPNVDACAWLATEVWPAVRARVPAAILTIVGRNPTAAIRVMHDPAAGIEVAGEVPDVRPRLDAADVLLVPLRMGSGTRLKVLEAMAAGLPVVSTPIGVEGLDFVDGEHGLLASDTASLAAATDRILTDLDLRRRVAAAARQHVEEHYAWDVIGRAFSATLARAAGGHA